MTKASASVALILSLLPLAAYAQQTVTVPITVPVVQGPPGPTGPAGPPGPAGGGGSSVPGRRLTLSRSNGYLMSADCPGAFYIGTIYTDAAGGTVTADVSYGPSRRWGVWNAYNRLPICVKEGELINPQVNYVSAFNYRTNGWGPVHSNAANSIAILDGLGEDRISIRAMQSVYTRATTPQGTNEGAVFIAIGWNSITIPSGYWGGAATENFGAMAFTVGNGGSVKTDWVAPPFVGVGVATALETDVNDDGGTMRRIGGGIDGDPELEFVLQACWRG